MKTNGRNVLSLKSVSLLAGLVLAALALTSWTQVWFIVDFAGQSSGHPAIEAGGDTSAPAISALAIAALASVCAMAISGFFFRILLAVLQVAIGASIALSALLALTDPLGAVLSLITKATGIAGVESARPLVNSITPTAWPWVALAGGVFLVGLGIVIMSTGRNWPPSTRKYELGRTELVDGAGSPESAWDSLSGGIDPTSR